MASINPTTIFSPPLATGEIAANAVGVLGEPVHINEALSKAIGTATATIVDTVNISAGAKLADDIQRWDSVLTGSPNGPQGVQGVHPIIDGIAIIQEGAKQALSGQ
jgi:hypothetical protein